MCFEAALLFLLLEEYEEIFDVLVQLMSLSDLVVLVHLDLADSLLETNGVIMRN